MPDDIYDDESLEGEPEEVEVVTAACDLKIKDELGYPPTRNIPPTFETAPHGMNVFGDTTNFKGKAYSAPPPRTFPGGNVKAQGAQPNPYRQPDPKTELID